MNELGIYANTNEKDKSVVYTEGDCDKQAHDRSQDTGNRLA